VSPLRGEKPQNWPLSKLNTGRFALRAMLPVKIHFKITKTIYIIAIHFSALTTFIVLQKGYLACKKTDSIISKVFFYRT